MAATACGGQTLPPRRAFGRSSSSASDFVTGTAIFVDGGFSIQG
jgi:hypothetical protein